MEELALSLIDSQLLNVTGKTLKLNRDSPIW
jgi:hypothetical protein